MLLNNEIQNQEEILVEEAVEEVVQQPEEETVVTPKKKRRKKKEVTETTENEPTDLTEKINEWKKQYKRIFKNEIDGETIIWRRLKRGEYKEILKSEEEDEDNKILIKQEKMVEVAMLYPFNASEIINDNAGLATVLSEEILAKSGFAISYTEEL